MQVPLGDTYYMKFTTRQFSTGAPFTLAGTPVVSVYEMGSLTQITAGVTLTVDFDSVTGLNSVEIVATSGNGYDAGDYYQVVITTGTVDSVSVVGEVVGEFQTIQGQTSPGLPRVDVTRVDGTAVPASGGVLAVNTTQIEGVDATNQINAACDTAISDYAPLQPSVLGRTLDVTATGEAGIDLDNTTGTLAAAQFAADFLTASGLAADAVTEIVNGVLAGQVEDQPTTTLGNAIAYILAFAAGQATGQDTTSPIFQSPNGAENRISATTDGAGNRSAITLTAPT